MKIHHPTIQSKLIETEEKSKGVKIVDGGFPCEPVQPSEYPHVQCMGKNQKGQRCKMTGRWRTKFCIHHRPKIPYWNENARKSM